MSMIHFERIFSHEDLLLEEFLENGVPRGMSILVDNSKFDYLHFVLGPRDATEPLVYEYVRVRASVFFVPCFTLPAPGEEVGQNAMLVLCRLRNGVWMIDHGRWHWPRHFTHTWLSHGTLELYRHGDRYRCSVDHGILNCVFFLRNLVLEEVQA